ncbi:MAG: ATP-binding protein [Thermoleophilia bacterium]
MPYRRRIVDDELDELLPALPALALEGPKGVGKSATAERRSATVHQLSHPEELTLAEADPSRVLEGRPPVFIDEFQRLPGTWDRVRHAVDSGAPPGSFLLAGSAATPEERHSGAGRIPILRMRPLSLAERDLGTPTVPLGALLTGDRPELTGRTDVTLHDYADEIVGSGFPGMRDYRGRALRTQIDGYLARVVDREITDETGIPVRRPEALRALMTAYAAATATTMSWEKVRAATAAGDQLSAPTARNYREALARLWIIDPMPAWLPTMSHIRRNTGSVRHHMADPGLAARLLGADSGSLLDGRPSGPPVPRDGSLLGDLFESLVALSVRVYAQQNEAQVFHFRTAAGDREVDLIVEQADRSFVAIEVKLTATPDDHDVRHLRWLAGRMGDRLRDAILVTTGRDAYRRRDGIGVVPAALLGP